MTTHIELTGSLDEPDPAHPGQFVRVVYQRTAPGLGNLPNSGKFDRQRRRHVVPHDPQTPAQVARRAKMAAAVLAWQAMTPQNRSAWTTPAAARNITPFNAFVSNFLRTP